MNDAAFEVNVAPMQRAEFGSSQPSADVRPVAKALHDEGLSLRQIAARLDTDGYATRRGGAWTAVQVARLLRRE